jgi:hypothetical protein
MTKWVTCTQPLFFPPLYMLERFARCDVVILMQEAQHNRQAEHSWCLMSAKDGPAKESLTCHKKNRRPIDEIEVMDLARWADKFERKCADRYGKLDGYREVEKQFTTLMGYLRSISDKQPDLAYVNRVTMRWLHSVLHLPVPLIASKDLVPQRPDHAPDWLAALTKAVGGTDYIQGATSIRSYFTPGAFAPHGIRVWGQDWKAPALPRLCEDTSIRLSALDAMFCGGVEWCREAIGATAGVGENNGTAISMEEFA